MTRKDYELLAAALRSSGPDAAPGAYWYAHGKDQQWASDCRAICDVLASQSSAFDRNLFLKNCGVLPT